MKAFLIAFLVLSNVFAVIAVLERVPAWRYRPQPFRRPWLGTDVTWYLTSALAGGLLTFILRPVLVKLALPGATAVADAMPLGLRFVAALLVFDLIAFSIHLAIHRSDTLWQFHKVHHSSRQLDVFATTRTQPFELLIRNVPAQLTLFALGMSANLVAVALLAFAAFGALNHSNLRLPLRSVEWLFITPRLHRIHHVPGTSQHNFATIFSFWDRASGRLLRKDTSTDELYGVPGEIVSFPQPFVRAFREPVRQLLGDGQGPRAGRLNGSGSRFRAPAGRRGG